MERIYIAIDLKSFYASVECIERDLDPLKTNLVVADESRTEKTICLAVTPSLKAYGISGRARLFEVVSRIKEVNMERKRRAPGRMLVGESYDDDTLKASPEMAVSYIIAKPRMAKYMEVSTRIYEIYLRFVAPEDIIVYSVDEVFLDVTQYQNIYQMTPRELARKIVRTVYAETGITATAGIGSNLYLCKVAMDIDAKHCEPDAYGARISELDEMSYRQRLWGHRPLTDFWRVGPATARKLEEHGMFTMGDVARCSLGKDSDYYNEALLFRLFGVQAEFLIDHAWGYEPVLVSDVKAYKPKNNSLSNGQVLHCPYTFEKTKIVVREMTDALVLALVDKGLMTNQIVLTIGYDIENLKHDTASRQYIGEVSVDRYGRRVPKHAHGTVNFPEYTSSTKEIVEETLALFDRIVNPALLTRRINVTANRVRYEADLQKEDKYEQLELFVDYEEKKQRELEAEKEKRLQKAFLDVQKKYGKNAILKGTNLQEGATALDRNKQIGGHKA